MGPGTVAQRRIHALLPFGCHMTVIAPKAVSPFAGYSPVDAVPTIRETVRARIWSWQLPISGSQPCGIRRVRGIRDPGQCSRLQGRMPVLFSRPCTGGGSGHWGHFQRNRSRTGKTHGTTHPGNAAKGGPSMKPKTIRIGSARKPAGHRPNGACPAHDPPPLPGNPIGTGFHENHRGSLPGQTPGSNRGKRRICQRIGRRPAGRKNRFSRTQLKDVPMETPPDLPPE